MQENVAQPVTGGMQNELYGGEAHGKKGEYETGMTSSEKKTPTKEINIYREKESCGS